MQIALCFLHNASGIISFFMDHSHAYFFCLHSSPRIRARPVEDSRSARAVCRGGDRNFLVCVRLENELF